MKITLDNNEVDLRRVTTDKTNQASIDGFNDLVDRTNAETAVYHDALDAYNLRVADYNGRLAALNAERERLRTLSQKINGADEK